MPWEMLQAFIEMQPVVEARQQLMQLRAMMLAANWKASADQKRVLREIEALANEAIPPGSDTGPTQIRSAEDAAAWLRRGLAGG